MVQHNTPVRQRITVCGALLALFLSSLYGPLFHVHEDRAGAFLVHAHLPEFETMEDETVVHMETPHSHAAARSVDLLVTIASHFIHLGAAIQSTALALIEPQASPGFVAPASPRAHAPPALESLTPRAPPA